MRDLLIAAKVPMLRGLSRGMISAKDFAVFAYHCEAEPVLAEIYLFVAWVQRREPSRIRMSLRSGTRACRGLFIRGMGAASRASPHSLVAAKRNPCLQRSIYSWHGCSAASFAAFACRCEAEPVLHRKPVSHAHGFRLSAAVTSARQLGRSLVSQHVV